MRFDSILSAAVVLVMSAGSVTLAASPEGVLRKSERVTSILNREGARLDPRQLEQVDQLLDEAMEVLRGRGGGGGGRGLLLTATCHVDDDAQFDWDQVIAGDVTGYSVQDLLSNCSEMGSAMYKNSSSGIKQLVVSGAVPRGMQGGTCHIDDDANFDFEQIIVGDLVGSSVSAIKADCEAITQSAYPGRGTSGIKNFKSY